MEQAMQEFEDKIVTAIADAAANVGDSIEAAAESTAPDARNADDAERLAANAREIECARLDIATGAPKNHHALFAFITESLRSGADERNATKSIAQRRRELIDSEATAALMGWPDGEQPRKSAPIDVEFFQIDADGKRSLVRNDGSPERSAQPVAQARAAGIVFEGDEPALDDAEEIVDDGSDAALAAILNRAERGMDAAEAAMARRRAAKAAKR
jgi:hypothetical protein